MAGGSTRPSEHVLKYWLPLIAYVTLIFTVSAQPNLKPPPQFPSLDKLVHLAEYIGLGVLLHRLVRAQAWTRRRDVAALIVLLAGMAIGGADERFQATIPGRSCELLDWLADSVGVGFAQLLCLAWTEWRKG